MISDPLPQQIYISTWKTTCWRCNWQMARNRFHSCRDFFFYVYPFGLVETCPRGVLVGVFISFAMSKMSSVSTCFTHCRKSPMEIALQHRCGQEHEGKRNHGCGDGQYRKEAVALLGNMSEMAGQTMSKGNTPISAILPASDLAQCINEYPASYQIG